MNVLPGDKVPLSERYGPGIENGESLVAGCLTMTRGVELIATDFKRYTPFPRDLVVGVIDQRNQDFYRVVLQPHSKPVKLDTLAFENATKKNRPNLVPGDVVYGIVATTDGNLEDEIKCYDSETGKSNGFGQLKEGSLVSTKLGFARELLFNGHPVLERMGKRYEYEIAIGQNGRIWVKGPSASATLEIIKAINEADSLF